MKRIIMGAKPGQRPRCTSWTRIASETKRKPCKRVRCKNRRGKEQRRGKRDWNERGEEKKTLKDGA
jgi:hypothetical protein